MVLVTWSLGTDDSNYETLLLGCSGSRMYVCDETHEQLAMNFWSGRLVRLNGLAWLGRYKIVGNPVMHRGRHSEHPARLTFKVLEEGFARVPTEHDHRSTVATYVDDSGHDLLPEQLPAAHPEVRADRRFDQRAWKPVYRTHEQHLLEGSLRMRFTTADRKEEFRKHGIALTKVNSATVEVFGGCL